MSNGEHQQLFLSTDNTENQQVHSCSHLCRFAGPDHQLLNRLSLRETQNLYLICEASERACFYVVPKAETHTYTVITSFNTAEFIQKYILLFNLDKE